MLCPAGSGLGRRGATRPRCRAPVSRRRQQVSGALQLPFSCRWSAPHLPRPGARRRAPAHSSHAWCETALRGLCAWQGPRGAGELKDAGSSENRRGMGRVRTPSPPSRRSPSRGVGDRAPGGPKPVHRVGDPTPVARATVYAGGPVEVPVPQPPVILPPLPPCQ